METLAVELVAMAMVDEAVRSELADAGKLSDGSHPEMRAVHERTPTAWSRSSPHMAGRAASTSDGRRSSSVR